MTAILDQQARTDPDRSEAASPYIRGGRSRSTTDRRVGRVVASSCLAALAALAIVLLVTAFQHDREYDSLVAHGVPVTLRVAGCIGIASGTGVTIDGYSCHGSYRVAGHRYTEHLQGTTAYYSPGADVAAIADARSPRVVAPLSAVATRRSRPVPFLAPSALLGAVIAGWGALVWSSRRGLAAQAPEPA